MDDNKLPEKIMKHKTEEDIMGDYPFDTRRTVCQARRGFMLFLGWRVESQSKDDSKPPHDSAFDSGPNGLGGSLGC